MGMPVLILGESGSGKTASLRNFLPGEIGIYNVAGKPLPFRTKLPKLDNATYAGIFSSLSKKILKRYVIDDSQYLMAFYMFDHANEKGFTKFTQCAIDFKSLIDFVVRKLPDDTVVYFLHHTELSDDGKLKAKTQGKMLDSQLTLEGLFSIVLLAETDGKEHWFTTQSNGRTPCKSPMGMFSDRIDNDLKMVDKTIREYYEMPDPEKEKANGKEDQPPHQN